MIVSNQPKRTACFEQFTAFTFDLDPVTPSVQSASPCDLPSFGDLAWKTFLYHPDDAPTSPHRHRSMGPSPARVVSKSRGDSKGLAVFTSVAVPFALHQRAFHVCSCEILCNRVYTFYSPLP